MSSGIDGGAGPVGSNSSDARSGRNGRNQKNKPRWSKSRQNKTSFVGNTRKMNGEVFQLQLEQEKKGQF